MFVVFEGIDGSGKTTISNRVAKALRERGLIGRAPARGGGVRLQGDPGDSRLLPRRAQHGALPAGRADALRRRARSSWPTRSCAPRSARADVVIADRYLYTAEVLAQAGRDLAEPPRPTPVLAAAASGPLARAGLPHRRRPVGGARAAQGGQDPLARSPAGLAQGADRERPADPPAGRLSRAGRGGPARAGSSSTTATPTSTRWSARSSTPSSRARDRPRGGDARGARRAWRRRRPDLRRRRPVDGVRSALGAFLAWVDHRARSRAGAGGLRAGRDGRRRDRPAARRARRRRRRGSSPAGCAASRTPPPGSCGGCCVESAPARGGASRSPIWRAEATEAWALRELLADVAPAEVAASLEGLDDETAWALRAELYPRVPEAVLASLALLDVPRAWELRTRWIDDAGRPRTRRRQLRARARPRPLGDRARRRPRPGSCARRRASAPRSPRSRRSRGSPATRPGSGATARSGRAPKAVLSTIAGMDDARAWALRWRPPCAAARRSTRWSASTTPTAWEIRETCLELWPPSVVKSLGVLVSGARGHELVERALAQFPDQISLLKQAAIITTGANLSAIGDGGLTMSPSISTTRSASTRWARRSSRSSSCRLVIAAAARRVPGISPLAAPVAERAAAGARGRRRRRR